MKILDTISEDEMVAVFLKCELTSSRFGESVLTILERDNKPKSIIENPDLNNQEENRYRKKILKDHRGYPNSHLFKSFPIDIVWKNAHLTKEELQNIRYANFPNWIKISEETRLAVVGARNILLGMQIFNVPNDNFFEVAKAIKRRAKFEKLILVAQDENSNYIVVLEGHLRLTSYCMVIEDLPEEIEVIVGFSEKITKWGFY